MTLVVIIVVAVLLVLGVGLLIFRLQKKAQDVVPAVGDRPDARRAVGVDEQGRPITEEEEPQGPPRDEGAFESLLQDEIHDRGMKQPAPDDEA